MGTIAIRKCKLFPLSGCWLTRHIAVFSTRRTMSRKMGRKWETDLNSRFPLLPCYMLNTAFFYQTGGRPRFLISHKNLINKSNISIKITYRISLYIYIIISLFTQTFIYEDIKSFTSKYGVMSRSENIDLNYSRQGLVEHMLLSLDSCYDTPVLRI